MLLMKRINERKIGFIDLEGNWVITPQFDYILRDFEGDDMIWDEMSQKWEFQHLSVIDDDDSEEEEDDDDSDDPLGLRGNDTSVVPDNDPLGLRD